MIIKCIFCEQDLPSLTELKEHSASCPKHPAVIRCVELKSALGNGIVSLGNAADIIGKMESFIIDLKDKGLRFDLNPCHDIGTVESSEEFWHEYARRMDTSIRERAAEVLDAY